jgi:hypothetical protein
VSGWGRYRLQSTMPQPRNRFRPVISTDSTLCLVSVTMACHVRNDVCHDVLRFNAQKIVPCLFCDVLQPCQLIAEVTHRLSLQRVSTERCIIIISHVTRRCQRPGPRSFVNS